MDAAVRTIIPVQAARDAVAQRRGGSKRARACALSRPSMTITATTACAGLNARDGAGPVGLRAKLAIGVYGVLHREKGGRFELVLDAE